MTHNTRFFRLVHIYNQYRSIQVIVIAGLPNNHNFKVKVIGLKILKEYQSHCLLLQVTKTNRYIYTNQKNDTSQKGKTQSTLKRF